MWRMCCFLSDNCKWFTLLVFLKKQQALSLRFTAQTHVGLKGAPTVVCIEQEALFDTGSVVNLEHVCIYVCVAVASTQQLALSNKNDDDQVFK